MSIENRINKTLEYKYSFDDKLFIIKVSVLSAPEDIEISNFDMDGYKGFVFMVLVSTQPDLPEEVFDEDKNFIYILESGGLHKLGHLEGTDFIESHYTPFLTSLAANILSVLLLANDSGHYSLQ